MIILNQERNIKKINIKKTPELKKNIRVRKTRDRKTFLIKLKNFITK